MKMATTVCAASAFEIDAGGQAMMVGVFSAVLGYLIGVVIGILHERARRD